MVYHKTILRTQMLGQNVDKGQVLGYPMTSCDKMLAKKCSGFCSIQGEDDYLTTIMEGSPEQKALALRNMNVAKDLRDQRNSLGTLPAELSLSMGEKTRMIHDAGNRRLVLMDLPGRIRRREREKASGDRAVDDAYSNSGITFDFYQQVFSRNSIDNNFMPLVVTVHYDRGFDNAFWNGLQMVFGDGGGQSGWTNPTQFLDIMGHELTHGVVNKTANLQYRRQSGALNESFADVMGSCIKQYHLKQNVKAADWLVADGIYKSPRPHGKWLRSMKEPSKKRGVLPNGQSFAYPESMDGYVETDFDEGGVHINSSIPNKAFYITATEIGGHAWEKAGKIWYRTLLEELGPKSQFIDAAKATIKVSGRLFGDGSKEYKAVLKAWSTVKVYK